MNDKEEDTEQRWLTTFHREIRVYNRKKCGNSHKPLEKRQGEGQESVNK
jgi:hypothetical protein